MFLNPANGWNGVKRLNDWNDWNGPIPMIRLRNNLLVNPKPEPGIGSFWTI